MREFYRGLAKFVGVVVVIGAIAVAVLYAFFVRVVEVGHNAMAPTVMAGDTIVVWKTQSFELGDAVLCRYPGQSGRYALARIVARAGQQLVIDGSGHITINGDSPDRDLHSELAWDDTTTGRRTPVNWADEEILGHNYRYFWRPNLVRGSRSPRRVERGYFLLNDNRLAAGEDSRAFGPVMAADCIGTLLMRLEAGPSPEEIGNARFDLLE
ncbi:MAG: signal peptidase I [Sandaracinaceae bacterium]